MEFSPSYLQWLSGLNEKNYYSADVLVKKIMVDNTKKELQDVVDMASCTHNTNINKFVYPAIRLFTDYNGKCSY